MVSFLRITTRCVGQISNLEFKVTDTIQSINASGELEFNPGLNSIDTGLVELTITGAPKSLDESLKDAQYTRSFEAEIGKGRFASFDKLLESVDMTREAGLGFIAELQNENSGDGFTRDGQVLPAYSKISDLDEVTYRWEIGWLESLSVELLKSIHNLSDSVKQNIIDLGSASADSLTDDYLATKLIDSLVSLEYSSLTNNESTRLLISDSFDPGGVVDTTYENLRFAGGPLYASTSGLDTDEINTALNHDVIIRAFSIIASVDEREKTTRETLIDNLVDLLTIDRLTVVGADGTSDSAIYPNHIAEALQAKVQVQKNKVNGIFGDSFDTENLSKESMAILNAMQGVIPDAGELFNDAAQTLSDIPVEEGSSMTVTTDESTGRTNLIIGKMMKS